MLGNAYNKGSAPAVVKIDMDELGFYAAIRTSGEVNEEFHPDNCLPFTIVEGTIWEESIKTVSYTHLTLPTKA